MCWSLGRAASVRRFCSISPRLAGVGTIGIVDGDQLERSNLQRQIAHGMDGLGRAKVESARQRMVEINPDVRIETVNCRLTAENGMAIIRGYDFVVEAADNFTSKFLVNDLCLRANIPFSHGGILAFTGQTMTIVPGKSRCYRCVFGQEPPSAVAEACSQARVLGAVAGIIGPIQAAEAMKCLLGIGELLDNSLLVCDAPTMQFRRIPTRRRDEGCCRSLFIC